MKLGRLTDRIEKLETERGRLPVPYVRRTPRRYLGFDYLTGEMES